MYIGFATEVPNQVVDKARKGCLSHRLANPPEMVRMPGDQPTPSFPTVPELVRILEDARGPCPAAQVRHTSAPLRLLLRVN